MFVVLLAFQISFDCWSNVLSDVKNLLNGPPPTPLLLSCHPLPVSIPSQKNNIENRIIVWFVCDLAM